MVFFWHYSRIRGRTLTDEDVAQLAAGRFAFINVWRSIDSEHPVMQQPLAVADENSIREQDRFLYELRFPERTGEVGVSVFRCFGVSGGREGGRERGRKVGRARQPGNQSVGQAIGRAYRSCSTTNY